MHRTKMKYALLTTALLNSVSAFASDDSAESEQKYIERINILGNDNGLRREAGSATLIGETELEKFKFDDINRVLYSVPGVNIREEDGYGLRPNIGFRGATPDRSKKITVMEDGVLIGPAPYSAPAAYYFPMMSKMTAVEVFKGPAATKYGPFTVAGALNMGTRQVPESSEGMVDLSVGSDGYKKAKGYIGDKVGDFGYLVEAVHVDANGFKELDGGGDTGFDKNDIMAKFRYDYNSKASEQVFELKIAYADELSNETYLGLTDSDFAVNPNRRYAASQKDRMKWQHNQVQLTHFWRSLTHNFDITTRAYRHDFERSWFKVNNFKNFGGISVDIQDVLAGRIDDPIYYNILTGAADSLLESQKIILGDNDRTYYSQGIQTEFYWDTNLFGLTHTFNGGIRYHQDQIERNHTEDAFFMRDGNLVTDGSETVATTTNREKTDAVSVFLRDTIYINALELTLGLRGEFLDATYQNRKVGQEGDWLKKETNIWLPSVSAFYQLSDNAGLLFGIHEGFIPTSPKESLAIEIENSVNYEFGGRYQDGSDKLEIVAFFNDISNLKESCSFANCNNNSDVEFQAGAADVYGLEVSGRTIFETALSFDVPVSIVYTYTDSEFKTSFDSGFPSWGIIEAGDELPYLPAHQLAINIGMAASGWDINVNPRFIDEMLEASGEGEVLSGRSTKAYWILDASASYELDNNSVIYVKAENIFDRQEVISRRPYGARPSKPQQFYIGYQYSF